MDNHTQLIKRIDALTVFSNLKNDFVIKSLRALLSNVCTIDTYCSLVSKLYSKGASLTEYISQLVCNDENFYFLDKIKDITVPELIEKSVEFELETLDMLSQITSQQIKSSCNLPDFVPEWYIDSDKSITEDYRYTLKNIHKCGYGIFAKYGAFTLEGRNIVPVSHYDPIKLEQLSGYERQHKLVIDNTKALVEGKPCNNTLLYGDAGTGKSTTVKAVAYHFMQDGLRLIELKKNQLHDIPYVLNLLNQNPLKFIIFIDDLSFTQNDDNFAALKATLEGGLHSTGNNVAVYATSNRRHLIKESFSDREGDDIHVKDTIEELHSLSERFGLTVSYQRPDKDVYITIVESLAKQYGVTASQEDIILGAERFALRSGGRSPRVARQYVELLMSGIV